MVRENIIHFVNITLSEILLSFADSWQSVINACLVKNSVPIREAAIAALSEMCKTYYNHSDRTDHNAYILQMYLKESKEDLWEFVRMGYVSAIGALPDFMLVPHLKEVLMCLIAHSLTPHDRIEYFKEFPITTENTTVNWSEARRDSVKALINVVHTVGYEKIDAIHLFTERDAFTKVFKCFLMALQEYTIDNRGDIGAWVREAAMNALYKLVTNTPQHLLNAHIVHLIVTGLVQQAVEKIDRTRALAGKLFCKIIYHEPTIPYIQHHEFIKSVFPADYSNILWLHAAHTFPLFCALLELPEYTESLIIGLIASVGQLTESLVSIYYRFYI